VQGISGSVSVMHTRRTRKPTRRYLQFSLRSLFVLTTLCAMWLGYLSKRAHDQRVAVKRILELGGSLAYDFKFDAAGKPVKNPARPGWPWLRRLVGDEYFQEVVRVNLDKTDVSDADLQLIGRLKHLSFLSLNHTKVSDAGLSHIRRLCGLRDLGLMETKITGAGLRHVKDFENLEGLNLSRTAVDDQGVKYIGNLSRLERLDLWETSVTSKGVASLTRLTNLDFLSLRYTHVDDSAISHLVAMQSLTELHLSGSRVSGEGLFSLREALPSCEVHGDMIDLSDLQFDDSQRCLRKWESLVKRMQSLHAESRLKLIDLSGSQVSDDFISALHGLVNLEMIDLRETRVTDAGVERLKRALPGCKLLR
jgi:uncharacterized protein YjbI with pentapeptide repeats